MLKLFRIFAKKPGLAPGTILHTGKKRDEKTRINLIEYDSEGFTEKFDVSVQDCMPRKEGMISWINVIGIHNSNIIEEFGNVFEIHHLILEDIVNTGQRIKTEDFDAQIFTILKSFHYNDEKYEIKSENISILIGNNYVISFLENEDIFIPIRNRIHATTKRKFFSKTDYLSYSLIDTIVDSYFHILEKIGVQMEILEEKISEKPDTENRLELQKLKEQILVMERTLFPLRRSIPQLYSIKSELIHEENQPYFRDVNDHAIQVLEVIDTMRHKLSEIGELYRSTISAKTNEVMKVLALVATIFIPLSFIAGVYGTNFQNIPELNWEEGFYVMLTGMTALSLVFLGIFKKKKWL